MEDLLHGLLEKLEQALDSYVSDEDTEEEAVINSFDRQVVEMRKILKNHIRDFTITIDDLWYEFKGNRVFTLPFITSSFYNVAAGYTFKSTEIQNFMKSVLKKTDSGMGLPKMMEYTDIDAVDYLDEDAYGYAVAVFNVMPEQEFAWLPYLNVLLKGGSTEKTNCLNAVITDLCKVFINMFRLFFNKDPKDNETIESMFSDAKEVNTVTLATLGDVGRYVSLHVLQSLVRKCGNRQELPVLFRYFADNYNIREQLNEGYQLYGLNPYISDRVFKGMKFSGFVEERLRDEDVAELVTYNEEDCMLDLTRLNYRVADSAGADRYIFDAVINSAMPSDGNSIRLKKTPFGALIYMLESLTFKKVVTLREDTNREYISTVALGSLVKDLGYNMSGYINDMFEALEDTDKEVSELEAKLKTVEKEKSAVSKENKTLKNTNKMLENQLAEYKNPDSRKGKKTKVQKRSQDDALKISMLEAENKDLKRKLADAKETLEIDGAVYTSSAVKAIMENSESTDLPKEMLINGKNYTRNDVKQIINWYSSITSPDKEQYDDIPFDTVLEELKGLSFLIYGGEANIISEQLNNLGIHNVSSTFDINSVEGYSMDCLIYSGEQFYKSIVKEIEGRGIPVVTCSTTNPVILCMEVYKKVKAG